MKFILAALLCLELCSACASRQHVFENDLVRVRGSVEEEVDFVQWVVTVIGPRVAVLLRTQQIPVDLHVLESALVPTSIAEVYGHYRGQRIWLGRMACFGYGHHVAHQLAHVYGNQQHWFRGLPPLIREGVCEFVALQASEEAQLYRLRYEDCPTSLAELPPGVWEADPSMQAVESCPGLRLAGFRIIDRVGLGAIRELAESGRLSPETVAALPDCKGHILYLGLLGEQDQGGPPVIMRYVGSDPDIRAGQPRRRRGRFQSSNLRKRRRGAAGGRDLGGTAG
jgi:hypothetical protein